MRVRYAFSQYQTRSVLHRINVEWEKGKKITSGKNPGQDYSSIEHLAFSLLLVSILGESDVYSKWLSPYYLSFDMLSSLV